MGLPSGVQWANCNLGAEEPSDSGLYFSWGNTEGHAEGSDYDFSQAVYDQTPAANIATDLSLEQDAARAILGEPWRMPSANDFQELIDNCTTVWLTINGVSGYQFTSNINGAKIFLPAARFYNGQQLVGSGSGRYWSSSYYTMTDARFLSIERLNIDPMNHNSRRLGLTVRAVIQL